MPTEFKMQGLEAESTDRDRTLKLEKKLSSMNKRICSDPAKYSLDSVVHRILMEYLIREKNVLGY